MVIVNLSILESFAVRYPQARNPIKRWVQLVDSVSWHNFADVKASFNAVDYANGIYIFDIKGNSYRLLAAVSFPERTVYIIGIMTHAEYSRIRFFRR